MTQHNEEHDEKMQCGVRRGVKRGMDADEGEESDADRVSANRERRSDAPAVVPTIHNAGKPLQGGSRRSMDADEGEESDADRVSARIREA